MSVESDLEIARNIIRSGVPVVLWKAGSSVPPAGWPDAKPDLSVVDAWKPGDKLYVVTGKQAEGGVDVADVDPRNGGKDSAVSLGEQGAWPKGAAIVSTPSGGNHIWLPPAGVRKGNPADGIDYQAGMIVDGKGVGRGLAGIPPTVGSSTNSKGKYEWRKEPDFAKLRGEISPEQTKLVSNLRWSAPPKGAPREPKMVLPAEAREAADTWESNLTSKALKKLTDLPSQPSEKGKWDQTVYGVARDLVRIANAPWTTATIEDIKVEFDKACELLQGDPDWNERMQDKWDRAIIEVPDAANTPADVLKFISSNTPDSLTDDGNATLFVDLNQDDVRYVPQARVQWHVWDGTMWKPDEQGKVTELIRGTLRRLPEGDKDLNKHKTRSLNVGGINACKTLASTDTRVIADQSRFDADPYKLNTPGGVVDLKSGALLNHTRDDYHSKITTVTPDFNAECPNFLKFLEQTFAGEDLSQMIPFIQQIFGYSISGSVAFDFIPFLYGGGQNGKTVLAQILYKILGDSYAAVAPSGLLTKAEYNHETTKAFLFGKRLVLVNEENEGATFNEARLKEYSGGEPLTARFMNRDDFTWNPTHTIWIIANDKPNVKTGGDAMWRRIKLIDFPNKVKEEDKILDLEDKLIAAEGPAILAWAIRGAVDLFKNGLKIPESAERATKEYASEEDHLQRFIEERCKVGESEGQSALKIKKVDLRTAYTRWCVQEGIKEKDVKDAKALSNALIKKGFKVGGSGRSMYYGIELVEEETVTYAIPSRSAVNRDDMSTRPYTTADEFMHLIEDREDDKN